MDSGVRRGHRAGCSRRGDGRCGIGIYGLFGKGCLRICRGRWRGRDEGVFGVCTFLSRKWVGLRIGFLGRGFDGCGLRDEMGFGCLFDVLGFGGG